MVTCPGNPYSAYEGEGDILLDCSATGKPEDSEYVYAWTARGGGDTDKLSSTTIAQPTFDVPGSVNSDETYEYTLTASAENAEDGAFDVTVEAEEKGAHHPGMHLSPFGVRRLAGLRPELFGFGGS